MMKRFVMKKQELSIIECAVVTCLITGVVFVILNHNVQQGRQQVQQQVQQRQQRLVSHER